LNNINLVHHIAQGIRSGSMPNGRIRVVEGCLSNGNPVYQFNYNRDAMFGNMTKTERACRGLIVDCSGNILALPMEKFYNLGEPNCPKLPLLPYQIWEKIDGSLGIIWHDGERWRCNTRGSFDSPYTSTGLFYWEQSGATANPNHTIMVEICVDGDEMPRAAYKPEGIYLLAVRDRTTGVDIDLSEIDLPIDCASQLNVSIDDILDSKRTSEGIEGWVVRFNNGFRVKVKTAWYLRVFRAIQGLTPKNIREMMVEGNDWVSDLPDDLQPEGVSIRDRIAEQFTSELKDVYDAYSKVAGISTRKDFAITVTRDYPRISSWLFKLKDNRFDEKEFLGKMSLDFM